MCVCMCGCGTLVCAEGMLLCSCVFSVEKCGSFEIILLAVGRFQLNKWRLSVKLYELVSNSIDVRASESFVLTVRVNRTV